MPWCDRKNTDGADATAPARRVKSLSDMVEEAQTHAAPGSGGLTKARLETLCDGVFAIAMTLMIFNIKVPRISGLPHGKLVHTLFELWPQFLAYAISFIMLGVYWIGHHNQFHYVRRSDRLLLWLNITFLMFVTVIPFSTGVLGRYPLERAAVVLYAGNLILVGLMLYAQWWYVTAGHRLVDPDTDPRLVNLAKHRILMGPAILLLAIGASFISPILSIVICAVVPAFYILPGSVDRHWSPVGRRYPLPRR